MNAKTTAMAILLLLVLSTRDARAWYGSTDGQASSVRVYTLALMGNTTYTFETDDLSQGGDTVIHLWNGSYFGGVEVAMNDDYNGQLRSRLTYTPALTDLFQLVVRSYDNGKGGTCDVKQNGSVLGQDIDFGGWHQGGTTSATDVAQTVLVNQGTDDTVLFAFDASGSLKAIDDDSGVGYTSRLTGSYSKYVVSTYGGGAPGSSRLVLNDAGNDSDGDGLGGELELALCTCDVVQTWPCGVACDYVGMRTPQDSDGDGIRDDWEVLGRDNDPSDADDFPQHLPRWGANPNRKDLFVEVDWLQEAGVYPLTGAAAQAMAAAYDASGTAASVHNRDGTDGIKLHIDCGVSSAGTMYGSWGGAAAVSSPDSTNPSTAEFVKSRRGVFKYGFAKASNSTGLGLYLQGFSTPYDGGILAAHELGHTVDLRHGGSNSAVDQNAKPHYHSLMNYAFPTHTTFSKGTFAAVTLNPTSLCEANGLYSTDRAAVAYLETGLFKYLVEPAPNDANMYWGIDWNRDGIISHCTQVIRAAPNQTAEEQAQPELGRYCKHRGVFSPRTITDAAPADTPSVTRYAGKLLLSYRDTAGTVRLLGTTASFATCETSCDDEFTGCASWPEMYSVATGAAAGGPALAVHRVSGVEYLVVAWNHGTTLRYAVYQETNGVLAQIGSPVDVPGASGALYEASLAMAGADTVLTYRKGTAGAAGPVYANTMPSTGLTFGSAQAQLRDEDGQALTTYSVLATANYPNGVRGLFGQWYTCTPPPPCPSNYYPEWREYVGSARWSVVQNTAVENISLGQGLPSKRMGLSWVPHASSTGLSGGRWYLVYTEGPSSSGGKLMLNMTRGDGSNANLVWENLTTYDNRWFKSEGGVALYNWRPNAAADTSLRLATVFRAGATGHLLEFRPKADGIANVALKDVDDYALMERGICASVKESCNDPFCLAPGEGDSCPAR